MDGYQNLEYGSSSSSLESKSESYPNLSMDEHQNLEYDCFRDVRGTVIIVLEMTEKLSC